MFWNKTKQNITLVDSQNMFQMCERWEYEGMVERKSYTLFYFVTGETKKWSLKS